MSLKKHACQYSVMISAFLGQAAVSEVKDRLEKFFRKKVWTFVLIPLIPNVIILSGHYIGHRGSGKRPFLPQDGRGSGGYPLARCHQGQHQSVCYAPYRLHSGQPAEKRDYLPRHQPRAYHDKADRAAVGYRDTRRTPKEPYRQDRSPVLTAQEIGMDA